MLSGLALLPTFYALIAPVLAHPTLDSRAVNSTNNSDLSPTSDPLGLLDTRESSPVAVTGYAPANCGYKTRDQVEPGALILAPLYENECQNFTIGAPAMSWQLVGEEARGSFSYFVYANECNEPHDATGTRVMDFVSPGTPADPGRKPCYASPFAVPVRAMCMGAGCPSAGTVLGRANAMNLAGST